MSMIFKRSVREKEVWSVINAQAPALEGRRVEGSRCPSPDGEAEPKVKTSTLRRDSLFYDPGGLTFCMN
jgi:hypothetical protein